MDSNAPRHAYCITAYNEPAVLQSLLTQLDDPRNDVFIHVDAKADMRQFERVFCKSARLFWTPRMRVFWGDMTQAESELLLFRFARAHGHYAYYHLVSGVDHALKSQDFIHDYCDRHRGEEFVAIVNNEWNARQAAERIGKWYFFVRMYRHPNGKIRRLFMTLSNSLLKLQEWFRISRNRNVVAYKGSNWVSVTEGFVDWLLAHEDDVRRIFHHTLACDEIFLQTLIMRSPFAGNVSARGNMREIDWERGDPYVWRLEDADRLAASDCFFARKFSSAHFDIITDIDARLETGDRRDNGKGGDV